LKLLEIFSYIKSTSTEMFQMSRINHTARNFFVHQIYVYGNVSDESYKSYFKGTADAVFLLDETVTDYLEEIRTKALRTKF